jgi:hypothetical protein
VVAADVTTSVVVHLPAAPGTTASPGFFHGTAPSVVLVPKSAPPQSAQEDLAGSKATSSRMRL